ncbi:transposase, partial [Escherichia coli]
GTADRNRSHWSTSKTPSYTKSVSWQHHLSRFYYFSFCWPGCR